MEPGAEKSGQERGNPRDGGRDGKPNVPGRDGDRAKGAPRVAARLNRFQLPIPPVWARHFKEQNTPLPAQRRVMLAQDPKARVIIVNNDFTHTNLNRDQAGDRALSTISNRVLSLPDPQVALASFAEYKEASEAFGKATDKLLVAVGLPPQSFVDKRAGGKDNGNGKGKEDGPAKRTRTARAS